MKFKFDSSWLLPSALFIFAVVMFIGGKYDSALICFCFFLWSWLDHENKIKLHELELALYRERETSAALRDQLNDASKRSAAVSAHEPAVDWSAS